MDRMWVDAVFVRIGARYKVMSTVALAVFMACITLLTRLTTGPLTIDDAFITFRYARNLAEGLGFVYNPGEHILGTTTPLYALILAALYRLGFHDLPQVSLVLGSLADAATALILLWLAHRLRLGLAWGTLAASIFALSQASFAFTVGGMESPLFTLLVVAAAAADASRRPGLAGLLAGLATVTRPEGLLMGALVIGRHLLARRFPPWQAVVAFLAPVLPWVAYATWWFGSSLPQSVATKAIPYQINPVVNVLGFLVYLGQGWLVITILSLLPLLLRVRLLRGQSELWALAAFAPLLTVAYILAATRNVLLFPWYVVPLVPFYILGAIVALRPMLARMGKPLAVTTAVVLLVSVLPGLNLGENPERSPLAPRYLNLVREEAFADAGQFLAPRLSREQLVALPEIGAFGYSTEARILDTIGLISPQATRFYPLPHGYVNQQAIPAELISQERPDYLIGMEEFFQGPLQETEWFSRQYRLIATFNAPLWHSKVVAVYERVGQ